MDAFFQALNRIAPLTPEASEALGRLIEPMSLQKNAFLLREGERSTYGYMLISGVIRVFYNKDGVEYNKTFFVDGTFPTALTSLFTGEPSQLSFQALVPSDLVRFSFERFRDLFSAHRCLESFMLRVMEREWIVKERHDIRMVTNDATTNYQIFREEFPGLENLIPQYHIASYLGITPIQLSRIRRGLMQG